MGNINFDALLGSADETQSAPAESAGEEGEDDEEKLSSMMNSLGTMARDEYDGQNSDEEIDHHHQITREFYGAPSGLAFLHRTRNYFSRGSESPDEHEMKETPDAVHKAIVQLFDAPLPEKQSLHLNVPVTQLLPPRKAAEALVEVVFQQVFPLFNFLDASSFQRNTARIYELEPIEYEDSDHTFLPLFYSIIGLGYLFSREAHRKFGCRGSVSQG